eukprot:scaffold122366_cov35-Attheya_sp.AAC.1
MECRQAVAGTVWETLELGIVVGARNGKGPGSNPMGLHHSAEGGGMLRCGNYLGFLFQVYMSWHVNSVQGLSGHTAITRPTQESENREGTTGTFDCA